MDEIIEERISKFREELDKLDKVLIDTFVERMNLVVNISEIKQEKGLPIFDRIREEKVMASRLSYVKDDNKKPMVKQFLTNLLDISRAEQRNFYNRMENKITVAYQGLPGSYSHQAASQYFRENFMGVPQPAFSEVFNAISNNIAQYGILPLENSSTGSIADVYDLIIRYGCYIVGEEIVEVDHCLLGLPDSTIEDISTVFSHEQGFQQCQTFLNSNKSWEQVPYHNTAVSAKHVSQSGNKKWAAIASREAAVCYGLIILAEGIQNQSNNYTRFIVVSPKLRRDENCNKVSISFVVKHESGSLSNIINIFAEKGLNLLKLESRPISGQPWQYRFYVDIEGNMEQDNMQTALSSLGKYSHEWRLLGNYPSAVIKGA